MEFEFDDKTKMLFEKEKMGKLLFMMSFPVIIAKIISAICNIADTTYIVGSVGTLGVAGIGIGFPIQLMVNSLGLLIGYGWFICYIKSIRECCDIIIAHLISGCAKFLNRNYYICVLL